MQMRRLGEAGPEISVVGFGCWEAGGADWGPNSSEREVIAAIRAGLESGVTWVDTAEVYGRGVSEQIVGRALAGRDDVLVFTKVAPDEGSGLRPEQVRGAIDASLRRLGRDHVDLYQVHWPDDSVPLEETWGAMAELVEAGKARLIGVSNFDRARVERCLRDPPRGQRPERALVARGSATATDCCPGWRDSGIGYLAYSPMAAGRLTGALVGHTFSDGDWRSGSGRFADWREDGEEWPFDAEPLARALAAVDRARPLAGRLSASVAQVALRWVLEQRGVSAVIAGSRDAGHTSSNAAAGDLALGAAELEQLEEIFVP